MKEDKTFTLTVGEGKAKYMDNDYDLDAKSVGEFSGTFRLDEASMTPLLLTAPDYSEEEIIGAFDKSQSGAFVVRIKLRTVNVEGDVKSVVVELSAE